MKKHTFAAILLGVFGGFLSSANAADCDYNLCCPAPTCCENSWLDGKFKVGADYLFFQTKLENTPQVYLTTDTLTTVPATSTSDLIHTSWKGDSGFRVYLGYDLPSNGWGVDAIYTYIPGQGSQGVVTPAAATATTTQTIDTPFALIVDGIDTPLASFSSKTDSTINIFDLDFSRAISCSDCFTIRPHMGFRAAWIEEKYHAAMPLTLLTAPTVLTANFIAKEKFQGYGLEGGLWADWKLGYGLSLVGHVGGSLLYAKFHNTQTTNEISTTAGVNTTLLLTEASQTYFTGTPTVDYFLGLNYADTMCDWAYSGYLGWEQHVFFNLDSLFNQGNLYTQGLVVGLDVSF